MKSLTLALCSLLLSLAANASTILTGTITITNAANLNGTSGQAYTINSDKRTWTNAVHTPSAQVLVNATNSYAAQAVVINSAAYPFTGLTLTYPSANSVRWTAGTDAALVISLTGSTWGYVTMTTNTIGTGQVVRVPVALESLVGQTTVANGLMTALNSDPNTTLLLDSKLQLTGTAGTYGDSTHLNYPVVTTDSHGLVTGVSVAYFPIYRLGDSQIEILGVATNGSSQLSFGNTNTMASAGITSFPGHLVINTSESDMQLANASGSIVLSSGAIYPTVRNAFDFGVDGIEFGNLYSGPGRAVYSNGYSNGAGDNSRVSMSHTGTNGVALFASEGSGIAGAARPFLWTVGGTNFFKVDGNYGASTTGLLIYENGSAQRVTIGASDSGDPGYRVLQVPN